MLTFPISVVLTASDRWAGSLSRMGQNLRKQFAPINKLQEGFLELREASGIDKLSSSLGGVASAAGDVGRAFERAFFRVGILAAGATTAVALLLRGTATAGDHAIKAARRFGITAEAYQELAYAAKIAGVEQEEFDQSLQFFVRRVGQVGLGNKQAEEGFRRLGINVRDAQGFIRPIPDLLAEVADQLNQLDDPLKRNALQTLILGKSSSKLASLLKGGSAGFKLAADEAHRLGVVLSTEAAVASEEFLDQWARVRDGFMGTRNAIGVALLPALSELGRKLEQYVVKHRPQIEAWARKFAEKLPERLEKIGALVDKLTTKLGPFVDVFVKVVDAIGPVPVILGAIGTVIAVTVLPAVVSLTASLVTLSGVIVGTPAGWILLALAAITLAVAAVTAAVIALWYYWDEVTWFMKTAWSVRVGLIEAAVHKLLSPVRMLRTAWGALRDFFVELWDGIVAKFESAILWIETRLQKLGNMLPDWVKSINWLGSGSPMPTPAGAGVPGGGSQGANGRSGNASIKVEFQNAPRGTRIVERQVDGVDLDLSLGYQILEGWF